MCKRVREYIHVCVCLIGRRLNDSVYCEDKYMRTVLQRAQTPLRWTDRKRRSVQRAYPMHLSVFLPAPMPVLQLSLPLALSQSCVAGSKRRLATLSLLVVLNHWCYWQMQLHQSRKQTASNDGQKCSINTACPKLSRLYWGDSIADLFANVLSSSCCISNHFAWDHQSIAN